MTQLHDWLGLHWQWVDFLEKEGHRVNGAEGLAFSLVSTNGTGKHFRWVLLTAKGASRSLRTTEKEELTFHMRQASRRGESIFVVIWFRKPVSKVIVVPARRALKLKRVTSSKGSIPWDG